MDLNELRGRVLRVNLARPQKMALQGSGNHASPYPISPLPFISYFRIRILKLTCFVSLIVWESEEWLRENAKPLGQSGGVGARAAIRSGSGEPENADGEDGEEAMEE